MSGPVNLANYPIVVEVMDFRGGYFTATFSILLASVSFPVMIKYSDKISFWLENYVKAHHGSIVTALRARSHCLQSRRMDELEKRLNI